MKAIRQARPVGVYSLVFLLGVLGLNALLAGFGFLGDPTGKSMGIPLEWLRATPFSDFFIPGLILFCVLGGISAPHNFRVVDPAPVGVMRGLERRTHEHWAWSACLTVGAATLIWIAVQFLMLGVRNPMQIGLEVFIAALGLAFVALSLLSSVRRYYAR